ncbi:cobalamin B12-binding domain-containing protein [Aquidulcibacter paucihalophilus]|uniref:cobalamin B12-binding domain-containing protein n=1 Tax=Aquidulcibacter paucihalophilus TaxID=1978549 RepID=UPI000A18DDA4|nr:cobalamin-dependent protein [Aquidulcibacter paucihalophilus]
MPNQDTLEHLDPRSHGQEDQAQNTSPQHSGDKSTDLKIMELLAQMVEGDIIPRLMLAHKTHREQNQGKAAGKVLGHTAVVDLAHILLTHEVDDVELIMHAYLSSGMHLDEIYVDLMAPAARHLGEMWENDTATFADVTIGLGRMQTLLNRLSDSYRNQEEVRDDLASGLFVTPAGEMHSFGIRMVDELFRRAGWRTLCEPNSRINDVLAMVASEGFHILGIGISTESQVPFVRELIRQVRKVSHNRHILVLVGGSYIVGRPELAASIGADFSASDGREAIAIAETVIYEHSHRH